MERLDPNAVMNLVSSVLILVAAALPFLKKSQNPAPSCGNRLEQFLKKLLSFHVRKPENAFTTGSIGLRTVLQPIKDVDVVFTCVDDDHIHSNLNRFLKHHVA